MEKKKILLTDDEPNILKVVAVRLKTQNYDVITAGDGETALNLVKEHRPDLILLDITLPKLNGYEVCEILKKDAAYKDIPVVLFSARAQQADKDAGMEHGADAYISKPFEPQQLLETIKTLLKEK